MRNKRKTPFAPKQSHGKKKGKTRMYNSKERKQEKKTRGEIGSTVSSTEAISKQIKTQNISYKPSTQRETLDMKK